MERWLKDDKGFLARALNDTKYLSKVAREYMSLICPQDTRVIPGQMTAMLRGKFGLNDVLGINGEKNRNDHRHHAVDACVIGVTDQGLLQRFASASADAREKRLNRLVENMEMPWGDDTDRKYFNSVRLAVNRIWVSHKPDHGHEGAMFDATIYSASGRSKSAAKDRNVIPFQARADEPSAIARHGHKNDVQNSYMGLLSNSNYCIEIFKDERGKWQGSVLRTFDAYQIVSSFPSKAEGIKNLRNPNLSSDEKPLAMRLMINDYIRAVIDGQELLLQVLKINSSGSITFIKPNETNISARYSAKLAAQKSKREGLAFNEAAFSDEFFQRALSADSLMTAKARRVTISPIGELNDPGFKE
jgi:CRISPR-associated endonuclease Csn1